MPQVFLSAKAVASMIVEGTQLEDTDLPRLYQSTKARLESKMQHVSLTAYGAAMKTMNAMQSNGVGPYREPTNKIVENSALFAASRAPWLSVSLT
jgi:hypothetical protein